MHTVPKALAGRVDRHQFKAFMVAVEQNLEGQGICWPSFGPGDLDCAPLCCIIPAQPCCPGTPCWCVYAYCYAKRRFDRVLTETCKEWAPAFGNGTGLSWRIVAHSEPTMYNIVFNLRALPTPNFAGNGAGHPQPRHMYQPSASPSVPRQPNGKLKKQRSAAQLAKLDHDVFFSMRFVEGGPNLGEGGLPAPLPSHRG